MKNEWKEYKVKEFAQVIGGGTPNTTIDEFWDGDIPWITPKDLSSNTEIFVEKGERFITSDGLNNSSAKILPPGSILLSTRAPVGYLAISKVPLATNQGFRNLILKEGFSSKFIYYLLKNNVSYLQSNASGTTFSELSGSVLQSLKFKIPPLHIQERIADILGTLDDKIELNQQMNKTLENMARAIFKSWFVDFEPVYAKMEGRDYPLPAEIMGLFPDELVDSELGLIPRGWRVSKINDVIETVGGGTPSTKEPEYWDNGVYHFATPKDLSNLSASILINTERKVTDTGLGKISSGLLEKGTVLMSSRAPVGYLAITDIPVCINQGFIAMKCNKNLSNFYMLNWAKYNLLEIKGRASGTTFTEINKRTFRIMEVLEPPQYIVQEYDGIVTSVYKKIIINLHKNITLEKSRDSLLPKLINGG